MPAVAAILALLVGIAGWYYLFYSRSGERMTALEGPVASVRRHRLRRANGGVMLVLAALFYAGFTIDAHAAPRPFVAVWLAVVGLLAVVLVLVLLDLRMTAQLRRRRRHRSEP